MGHIFLLGSSETEPESVLEVDAMILWGKEAECGLRESVFLAWSTGKTLEHKLYHVLAFLEAGRPPFQLAIDRRLFNIQTNSAYQLRAVLWRRGSRELPMVTGGAQPTKGIWVESCMAFVVASFSVSESSKQGSTLPDNECNLVYWGGVHSPGSNPQPVRKHPSPVTQTDQLGWHSV